MKINNLIFLILLVLTAFFSSCEKERNQTATVERDCTGTYLRLDGKDYHVCNIEKLSSYADGAKVTTTFKKTENCKSSSETVVCYMLHENEGWIDVIKVK